MHKNPFVVGVLPELTWGAYSAPPDRSSWINGGMRSCPLPRQAESTLPCKSLATGL